MQSFSDDALILQVPLDRISDGRIEMGEFKIGIQLSQLFVRSGLLILTIGFRRIEPDGSPERKSIGDGASHMLNGHFIIFIDCN